MISVGRFAELAKVSARTVRYYESIGLLPTSSRGENNYRYYDAKWLAKMNRIRDLQDLGFSLEEIKQIIDFSESDISNRLKSKLLEIEQEIDDLEERKSRIKELLSVSNKIQTGESLTETERNLYMESIKEEIIKGLSLQYDVVTESTLSYLNRDGWLPIRKIGNVVKAKLWNYCLSRRPNKDNIRILRMGFREKQYSSKSTYEKKF